MPGQSIIWEGTIAPVAGALKVTGKDGSWRVTFEGGRDSLSAMNALAAVITDKGQALMISATTFTPEKFPATRADDDGEARALASEYDDDDGDSGLDYENDAWDDGR